MYRQVEDSVEKVCRNIATIRKYRGYSQDYVAFKIGMSQNGYSKIELNKCKTTVNRLYDIAAVLEVKVSDLIDLDLKKINDIVKDKSAFNNFLKDYYSALRNN